jgi:hypothetical protein
MSFWDLLIRRLYFGLAVAPPTYLLDEVGQEQAWRILTIARMQGLLVVADLDDLSLRLLAAFCPPYLLLYQEAEQVLAGRGVALPPPPNTAGLAALAAPVAVYVHAAIPFTLPLPPAVTSALLGALSRVQGLFNGQNPEGLATTVLWAAPELADRVATYTGPMPGFPVHLFRRLVEINLGNPSAMPPWTIDPPWFVPATPGGPGVLLDGRERRFLWCCYNLHLDPVDLIAVLLLVYGNLRRSDLATLLAGYADFASQPDGADQLAGILLGVFARIFNCMQVRRVDAGGPRH